MGKFGPPLVLAPVDIKNWKNHKNTKKGLVNQYQSKICSLRPLKRFFSAAQYHQFHMEKAILDQGEMVPGAPKFQSAITLPILDRFGWDFNTIFPPVLPSSIFLVFQKRKYFGENKGFKESGAKKSWNLKKILKKKISGQFQIWKRFLPFLSSPQSQKILTKVQRYLKYAFHKLVTWNARVPSQELQYITTYLDLVKIEILTLDHQCSDFPLFFLFVRGVLESNPRVLTKSIKNFFCENFFKTYQNGASEATFRSARSQRRKWQKVTSGLGTSRGPFGLIFSPSWS